MQTGTKKRRTEREKDRQLKSTPEMAVISGIS